jgi:NAD(P)-dependent dehydrogenase (short-subunit alcohol dehydrogenase family)
MAKEPVSLQGRVVAITGGARGIGRATAKALARKGARVAIGDLDADLAGATAEELGPEAIALELDVTKRESFADFLAQVEERLGPLDVIVNNAGIMPVGPFIEESDETAVRQIDINLHGVIYGMKLAIPGMMRRGSGHIVNMASQAGKAGIPGGATYSATKHAVVGLSEAVRAELRDTGVELSCVMPGVVNTELGSGLVQTRGVKFVDPEDVADSIVAALERPKFDVFVPGYAGGIHKLVSVLPRPAREAVARALKADRVLAGADHQKRAAYEERAAHSEPGLEPERTSEKPAKAKRRAKAKAGE